MCLGNGSCNLMCCPTVWYTFQGIIRKIFSRRGRLRTRTSIAYKLSWDATPYTLLGWGEPTRIYLLNQQLWPVCLGGSRVISQSLADRTLPQVAQTASKDKAFLRHITQCCQDTSLCCYNHFLSCGNSAAWHETDINHVCGFADSECVSYCKNAPTRFARQN